MKVYPCITPNRSTRNKPSLSNTNTTTVDNNTIQQLTNEVKQLKQLIQPCTTNTAQYPVQADLTELQHKYDRAIELLQLYSAKLNDTQQRLNQSKHHRIHKSHQEKQNNTVPPLDISNIQQHNSSSLPAHQSIKQYNNDKHTRKSIDTNTQHNVQKPIDTTHSQSNTAHNQSHLSNSVILNNSKLHSDIETSLADVADIISLHKQHYTKHNKYNQLKSNKCKSRYKPQYIALREISSSDSDDSSSDDDIDNDLASNNTRISQLLAIQRNSNNKQKQQCQHRHSKSSTRILDEIRHNIEQAELQRANKLAESTNDILHDITNINHNENHSSHPQASIHSNTPLQHANNSTKQPLHSPSVTQAHTPIPPTTNNSSIQILNDLQSTTAGIANALLHSRNIDARYQLKQLYYTIPAVLAALNKKQNKTAKQTQRNRYQHTSSIQPVNTVTAKPVHVPIQYNSTTAVAGSSAPSQYGVQLTDDVDDSMLAQQLNIHTDNDSDMSGVISIVDTNSHSNQAIDDLLND